MVVNHLGLMPSEGGTTASRHRSADSRFVTLIYSAQLVTLTFCCRSSC